MLAALEKGVKGTTLLSWGCSHFRQPESRYASPHEDKPPTGEPDAGNPHVRFGREKPGYKPAFPTPIKTRFNSLDKNIFKLYIDNDNHYQ